MRCGQSTVSKFENGVLYPNGDYVKRFANKMKLLEFEKGELLHLVELFSEDISNWNLTAKGVLRRLIHQNTEIYKWSEQIRVFNWTGIPNLLHTPGYATSIFKAASGLKVIDESNIVQELEDRRKILNDKRKLFYFVLSENALRLNFCNEDVAKEQFDWLKKCFLEDNIKIRILPTSIRLEVLPFTNFYVFDKKLVLIILKHGAVKIWNKSQIQEYIDDFKDLETICISSRDEFNQYLDSIIVERSKYVME